MSGFDTLAATAAGDLFALWGDAATYTPPAGEAASCTVVVERDVEVRPPRSEFGVTERRVALSFRRAEVDPVRGATVTVGAESWVTDAKLEDDGVVARWVMRA